MAADDSAPTEGVWAERKLRFRTAEELAADPTWGQVEWIAEPWLAAGSITELDGKVKIAGKTTWALNLCRSALDGAPFIGEKTLQTPVVFLTEQNEVSFRAAMERAGLLGRPDFIVLFWHDTLGITWRDIVCGAVRECQRRGARVLVVDTIAQFARLAGDSENNAGDALEAMRPLQAAAAAGIAVLVLRHERKSGGEVGDSGRGSSAFAGAVDVVLSLRRPDGKVRPSVRVIHAVSRFSETPDELVIELTPDGYVAHGTAPDVAHQEALEIVLGAIPQSEGAAITIEQIIDETSATRTTVQRAISELLAGMRIARTGKGRSGDPFRYYVSGSAQTPSPGEQNGQRESEPQSQT